MKNYINWLKPTKKIKKKDYILNYEIKDQEIIIHYAKGKSLTIANTKENIKVLEEKLKTQINSFMEMSDENLSFLIIPLLVPFFIISMVGIANQIVLQYLLYATMSIIIPVIIGAIIVKIKKKDLKKNKLLLANLERINERFNENPVKVYKILKTKKTKLEEVKEEDNSIKLNDADLFTKQGVTSLVETLDKEQEFTHLKQDKPKMRIRRKNERNRK